MTLDNVTQANNLGHFLTVDGGTATISGGTFGTSNTSVSMVIKNNATLNITNNPTFNFQGSLVRAGEGSDPDPDWNAGYVTINSGTYNSTNTAYIVELKEKAVVTINGGTFTSSDTNSTPIFIGNYGYKSFVTINDLASDSPYVFRSNGNPNITNFTAQINNGHFKYNKGKFAIDSNNGLKPTIKIVGGYFGPSEVDADALQELNGFCLAGYQAITLTDSDSEKVNGYFYKVESSGLNPNPKPQGNYLDSLDDMFEAAIATGSTDTIYWDEGDALPNYIMKLLFENPKLSLDFKYTYEGVEHEIYIGPGQATNDDIEWYGPLWLLVKYGEKKDIQAIPIHGVYVIQKGDSLSGLAKKLNTTVDVLLSLNPYIKNRNRIYTGNMLNY